MLPDPLEIFPELGALWNPERRHLGLLSEGEEPEAGEESDQDWEDNDPAREPGHSSAVPIEISLQQIDDSEPANDGSWVRDNLRWENLLAELNCIVETITPARAFCLYLCLHSEHLIVFISTSWKLTTLQTVSYRLFHTGYPAVQEILITQNYCINVQNSL